MHWNPPPHQGGNRQKRKAEKYTILNELYEFIGFYMLGSKRLSMFTNLIATVAKRLNIGNFNGRDLHHNDIKHKKDLEVISDHIKT